MGGKPQGDEARGLTQNLDSVCFQGTFKEVQQLGVSKVAINHSLKFSSGLSSKETCIDKKKRKLVLKAITILGLGKFDKKDICVSQRIQCRVASNEEDEVFYWI